MFTVKVEKTGRILYGNYDHDVASLQSFRKREDAEANLRRRRRALQDEMPFDPTFEDGDHEFTMKVDRPNYNMVYRYYIEKE